MTSYMVRVYPGTLAPSTVFIPVKIDETSTASDIARRVACQLDLKIQNPSLVEEIPNAATVLNPQDYPFDRYMLWPKQAKSARYASDKYKFILRQGPENEDSDTDRDRQLLESRGLLPVEDQMPQDLCSLISPSNHSLLRVLRRRFENREIYSWAGPVLVSLNPYKNLPIYTPSYQALHRNRGLKAKAHVFAVADAAFGSMKHENVSIIVSGESGSGKSFSTQILIQHLLTLARIGHQQTRLTASGPILENFGHAKTRHNNNSSRVGKFVTLDFSVLGRLTGAKVEQYLLEISRVIQRHPNERNFHIFYTLIYGLTEPERKCVGLRQAHEYEYLKYSDMGRLPEWDDGRAIIKLQAALESLGLYDPGQERLFKLMAGILAIGNIDFKNRNDQAVIADGEWLNEAARLLCVKVKTLEKVLTEKSSKIGRRHGGGETLTRKLNLTQACDARDGLAKACYRKIFDFLLLTLNAANEPEKINHKHNQIGILDIFGFERVNEGNGFEQFCINYANETLQLFSNEHIFKLEKLEHENEDIPWKEMTFPNNESVISLYNRKPDGLFSLLNENLPGQNNLSLLLRFNEKSKENKSYKRTNSETNFEINHYAGWVNYNINNFTEKNRDVVASASSNLLRSTECWLLKFASARSSRAIWRWRILQRTIEAAKAFRSYRCTPGEAEIFDNCPGLHQKIEWAVQINQIQAARSRLSTFSETSLQSCAFRTTTSLQYTQSLNNLMLTLKKSRPYFIRCIKSNSLQQEMVFDDYVVRDQLISSGMEETVRIKQSSYPIRIEHENFKNTYKALFPKQRTTSRDRLIEFLSDLGLPKDSFQVGKTLVFLREQSKANLDQHLEVEIIKKVKLLQKNVRLWLLRKTKFECHDDKRHKAAIIIQSVWRGYCVREELLRDFDYSETVLAATLIQRWWRSKILRLNFLNLKEIILKLQAGCRGFLARENYRVAKLKHLHARHVLEKEKRRFLESDAALKIQSYWRMYHAKKGFRNLVEKASVIQRAWRSYIYYHRNVKCEKFQTMKKIISLTPPETPPPSFTPPPPPSTSPSPNVESIVFNYPMNSDDPKLWRKKSSSSNSVDILGSKSAHQRSPDRRWNVGQMAELRKDRTPSRSVKPPTNNRSDPYQAQLVKKTHYQLAYKSEPDCIDGSISKSAENIEFQQKQSSRKHKREQEKQQLERVTGKLNGKTHERIEIRKPRQERLEFRQTTRNSCHEFELNRDSVPVPSPSTRDSIHERIELRPDGSRLSFYQMNNAYSKQNVDNFKSLPVSNLNRSDSIRERREVPPPKREPRDRVIRIDRSISLREKKEDFDVNYKVPGSAKLNKRIQRRRSNSVDSNHSGEFVKNEFARKKEERVSIGKHRKTFPDWPVDQQITKKLPSPAQAVKTCKDLGNIDPRFVVDSIQSNRRRKISEREKKVEPVESKKTIFSNFSARNFLRKKKQKKKEIDSEKSSAKFLIKKPEKLPVKIVLHLASTENIMSLKKFLTERLPKNKDECFGSHETSEQQDLANEIWSCAVEEFKKTLNILTTVSPTSDVKLADLINHFDEALDKEIEKKQIVKDKFPKVLYLNGFRKTLEDYIQEKRTMPKRPKGAKTPKKKIDVSGHNWSEHRVFQPNNCVVCEKSLWMFGHQKHQICSICKSLIHKKCGQDPNHPNYPKCKPSSENQLFGVHLERICKEGEYVPDFVSKVLHYLELHGTMKEGIYRVPGAKLEVDRMKIKLDSDPHCSNLNFDEFNVNAVAAAFKDFLRKLPVPLLPYDFYSDILRVMDITDPGRRDDRYNELTRILMELPRHHKDTIERIFFHLASVARKSEENRMDPQSLAIVLAPCIIRAPPDLSLLKVAEQIKFTTKAVELIIAHRLEDLKMKFKSISELETAETKITRRLTTHRQSRRNRHRRSHIHDTEILEENKEEDRMTQELARVVHQKQVLLTTLGDFETTPNNTSVQADIDFILNRPIGPHENGFSRYQRGRHPILRSKYSNIRTTKSTNL